MYNFKRFLFTIKSNIIPIFIYLFTVFLLVFSNNNVLSAKSGIVLWANSVVPSLLPFFIATELLGYTNIISLLGRFLNKIMRPIFNVPGEGVFPFIMGIISGYPMGAKIVSDFKNKGVCTCEEAERLIAFTNNSGPLFIIGTVGIGLFKDLRIGILLFFTHILACLTVGFIFRWWKTNKKRFEVKDYNSISLQNSISISNLGEILANSIMSAINTVFLIGGFIVVFSVIISILQNSKLLIVFSKLLHPLLSILKIPFSYSNGILIGLLELTNGIYNIASITNKSISINIVICSFILGFGGISVALQILSIVSKSKISIKPYIIGKLLQGFFAAFYTFLFLNSFNFFNLNL